MRSALYYPHTTIDSDEVLKTALLLWDQLEFIVPWAGYEPHYENPIGARAMELMGRPHVPTDQEKEAAHVRIEELVSRPLPPQFYIGRVTKRDERYEIYPQKLMPRTWELLRYSRVAGRQLRSTLDMPLTEPAGLTVMSVLADCCAGKTKARITDRADAYATLTGILGSNTSYEAGGNRTIAQEQLVPIALELMDTSSITLKQLVEFREREQREGSHDLTELRHRYVDALATYVKRLTTEVATARDADEIKRSFADDMRIDLKNYRREIRSGKVGAAFSKEVLVTTLAAIGTAATWLFGVPVPLLGAVSTGGAMAMVGGLIGAGNKYLSDRRAIMRKHPMAYVYELHSLPSTDFLTM